MLNLTFKGQLNNLTHQIVFNGFVKFGKDLRVYYQSFMLKLNTKP